MSSSTGTQVSRDPDGDLQQRSPGTGDRRHVAMDSVSAQRQTCACESNGDREFREMAEPSEQEMLITHFTSTLRMITLDVLDDSIQGRVVLRSSVHDMWTQTIIRCWDFELNYNTWSQYNAAVETAVRLILDAILNYRDIHNANLGKATAGTGPRFTEWKEYCRWLVPEDELKTMWGTGMPGAGKTIFACIRPFLLLVRRTDIATR
ncbi:hypothetical protein BKA70DRAFT_1220361 [Coprinopsis sp. MPI-PUGE-AT-0042]|nr:hypothetical protein BKA70DRAFT_1220361 [Coprinopsis sp. MPI-PUGE-AT-0042]